MDRLTLLQWIFDSVTGLGLLLLACWALASPRLFKGVILFVAFGLMMSLAWVRLDAPDIALAEIAIGAGLTGALLLAALARLVDVERTQVSARQAGERDDTARAVRLLPALLLATLAVILVFAVLALPAASGGLSAEVAASLEASGVRSPVTAVLLNFRGYDTLLEILILLLALLGVWSLGGLPLRRDPPAILVLDTLARLLLPALLLSSAYLIWAGSHAPGGAFQAGSVLGAAGVLLSLAGWQAHHRNTGIALRLLLIAGPGVFLAFALYTIVAGQCLLEYPRRQAGVLIVLLEIAATLSIGTTLAALFVAECPAKKEGQ